MSEVVNLERHKVYANVGPETPCKHKHPHVLTGRDKFKLPNRTVNIRDNILDKEDFRNQIWALPCSTAFVSHCAEEVQDLRPLFGLERVLVTGRRVRCEGGEAFPLIMTMLSSNFANKEYRTVSSMDLLYHSFDDEPAFTYEGFSVWMHQGRIHREKGPAIVAPCGSMLYLVNDVLHRTDGPACVWSCGREEWFSHGMRVNGPASPGFLDSLGTKIWYDDGFISRMITKTGWTITIAYSDVGNKIEDSFRVTKGDVDVTVKKGCIKHKRNPTAYNGALCTLDIYRRGKLVVRKKITDGYTTYLSRFPVEGQNRLPFVLQLLCTLSMPKTDQAPLIL